METVDRYCEECGAVNAREATLCFACSRPLDVPSMDRLERTPDEKAALEIPVAPGVSAQLKVQQSQPQPAQPLLHGRYRVLSQVGTGGFGAVYKARDLQANGRMVAIKAIELDTLSASQAIEATDTFNRELNLLTQLDHPHLPTIYEHFIDETHWYLVMDFIEGETLDEYFQQMHPSRLPLKQVLNIGIQLCDVLRYLHQLQPPVIFRDLKPANIMRTPGGRLYLIDFGIARRFKPGQTRDTTPLGSPGFAAPEQYGKAQTTPRSDIYSLGATLYFLLTGYDPAQTPFHLPPIRSLCPSLPEPLAELLTSMLALDPVDRPASISVVLHTFNSYGPSTRHTTVLAQTQAFAAATSSAASPTSTPSYKLKNFLKGVFSVAMTCMVIAACTLTAHFMGTASYSQSSSPIINPAPTPPQTFRTPYIGQFDSLNPFATTDPQAAELENLLFGRLVSLDKSGDAIPAIANSWMLSPDGLSWTFYLSTKALFSDGSLITSADVAASLNYALSSPLAPTTCPLFNLIKDARLLQTHRLPTLLGDSVIAVDPTAIVIRTSQPAPYFLAALATPCGSIVKKSDLERWGDSAFAQNLTRISFSSTYTVAGYGPGQMLTLVYLSSNNYQLAQPVQTPDQIVVQGYPDALSSYAAYRGGELDMTPLPDNPPALSQTPIIAHPLALHYYGMNYLAKPFDNVAVRQAFALALNRDTLAAFSWGLPTSSLLGSWRNPPSDSSASDDPIRARQLLTRGLAEEGLNTISALPPITFAYQAGLPKLVNEVNAARQMWKDVLGVEVRLRPVDNLEQAIAATRGNAGLQLWADDYTPPYLDPYAMVVLPFAQDSSLNAVNFGQNASPDVANQQRLQDELLTGTRTFDESQLLSIYQEADQALVSDAAWLPIYMDARPYLLSQGFMQPFSRQWSPWGSQDYCTSMPPC